MPPALLFHMIAGTAGASCFAPGRHPARTCVGVRGLARGALIEIDLVARRPAPVAPGLPAGA